VWIYAYKKYFCSVSLMYHNNDVINCDTIQDLLYLPWLNDKDVETFGHDRKGKQTETPIESTGIRSLDAGKNSQKSAC